MGTGRISCLPTCVSCEITMVMRALQQVESVMHYLANDNSSGSSANSARLCCLGLRCLTWQASRWQASRWVRGDRGNTDERSGVSGAELAKLPELAELAELAELPEQRQVYKLVWVLHECDVRQPVKLIKCKIVLAHFHSFSCWGFWEMHRVAFIYVESE